MAVLARHSARFDMLQVQFDPVAGGHLAVAGLRTVQVELPMFLWNSVLYFPDIFSVSMGLFFCCPCEFCQLHHLWSCMPKAAHILCQCSSVRRLPATA